MQYPPLFIWWIAGGVLAVAAVAVPLIIWKRSKNPDRKPLTFADILTGVAASIATGVSANGMWRFAGDVLGLDGPWRVVLFAFIEVAIVTSAVRARKNVEENFSAGIDGTAVWVLTSLTAVLSSLDARSFAEAVFRLSAPLVAAWLWERGMANKRMRLSGLRSIHWRITPERILVRLGLAEASDRTASEVDAHRRITRVALAAKKARDLEATGAWAWRVRRSLKALDKAVQHAVEHTGLAADHDRMKAMLDQIGAIFSAADLRNMPALAPWSQVDHPAVTGKERNSDAIKLARSLDRWTNATLNKPSNEAMGAIKSLADFATRRDHVGALAAETGRDRGVTMRLDAPVSTTRPATNRDQTGRDHATTSVDATSDQAPTDHHDRSDADAEADEVIARLRDATAGRDQDPTDQDATTPTARPTATRTRPDAGRDQNGKWKAHEVRDHVAATITETGHAPKKRDLADASGWGGTWCLKTIKSVCDQLLADGWTQDATGTWTRPADPVATVNGSAVAS